MNWRTAARRGLTLVEAMAALTVMAMASAVALTAVQSSLQLAEDSVDETIAAGLAEQLLDEALGQRYMAVGTDPYQYPFGPSAWEQRSVARERWNDMDDYHGWTAVGVVDRWGIPLGDDDGHGGRRLADFQLPRRFLGDWRRRVEMHYVADDEPSIRLPGGQTSSTRSIEVVVERPAGDGWRELARARRVVTYVGP